MIHNQSRMIFGSVDIFVYKLLKLYSKRFLTSGPCIEKKITLKYGEL